MQAAHPPSMFPTVIRRWSTTATKPAKFGQPVFASHPHLSSSILFPCRHILISSLPVKRDELTPGISAREYESRRQRLVQTLPDNSLVVLMGGKVKYMSNRTSPACCYTPVHPHQEARDFVCRAVRLPPNWPLTPSSYKFRQASDFWYLTGFDEPDAAVILGSSLRLRLQLMFAQPLPDQKRPALKEGIKCLSSRPARTQRRRNGTVQGQ